MPPRLGMKSMAAGTWRPITIASWPAPLAMRRRLAPVAMAARSSTPISAASSSSGSSANVCSRVVTAETHDRRNEPHLELLRFENGTLLDVQLEVRLHVVDPAGAADEIEVESGC